MHKYLLFYIEKALKTHYTDVRNKYPGVDDLIDMLSEAEDIEEFGDILIDLDNLLCDIDYDNGGIMGHYDEFEEERIHSESFLDTKVDINDVKRDIVAGTNFTGLCPPSRSIVEQLGMEESIDEDYPLMEGLPNYKESLKETDGKAADARFCYLGEHSMTMNKSKYHHLESLLRDLTEAENMKCSTAIKHCCEMALHAVRDLDDNFLDNLVKVRAHALQSGKYSLNSYREELDIKLLIDAAARHMLKIIYISDLDEESGVSHLGHIAANLIMINTQARLYGA